MRVIVLLAALLGAGCSLNLAGNGYNEIVAANAAPIDCTTDDHPAASSREVRLAAMVARDATDAAGNVDTTKLNAAGFASHTRDDGCVLAKGFERALADNASWPTALQVAGASRAMGALFGMHFHTEIGDL